MSELDDAFLDESLRAFVASTASADLLPGAGTVAALTAAQAAGIVGMAARRAAEEVPDAAEVAGEADELRERLLLLAVANRDAYREASTSLGRMGDEDDAVRDRHLGSDLARAAYTPLSSAEVAAEVAELAALVAQGGQPDVRPDAAAACCLAEGAARTGAHLVAVNLSTLPEDERVAQAADHVASAAESREKALAAGGRS